tara:strand:- start:151 stop:435 length:285 start_codon:yes stop_codon:yes gene_type:complete
LNQVTILCRDKYEAQKLSSLIFVKESMETYITEILNVIENEIIVSIKDKSAHSIILKDNNQVMYFADFIQSVLEKKHKIIDVTSVDNILEIKKE